MSGLLGSSYWSCFWYDLMLLPFLPHLIHNTHWVVGGSPPSYTAGKVFSTMSPNAKYPSYICICSFHISSSYACARIYFSTVGLFQLTHHAEHSSKSLEGIHLTDYAWVCVYVNMSTYCMHTGHSNISRSQELNHKSLQATCAPHTELPEWVIEGQHIVQPTHSAASTVHNVCCTYVEVHCIYICVFTR